MRTLSITLLAGLGTIFSYMPHSDAVAREQIRAVGSSTVYPFITVAAEEFGRTHDYKTPIIESTGTGGGFKLFCSGTGMDTPDIVNASRAIKSSEKEACAKAGVTGITEIKLGYDGIVIANIVGKPRFSLTEEHLFKALAREVPKNGKVVKNFYKDWNEIDPKLPEKPIAVYGPPPTSGTRDAFVELVMQEACEEFAEFQEAYPDEKQRQRMCSMMREDGVYIEAGENDNLIVQKLSSNPDALGIFGFSFLDQNTSLVQGSVIEGAEPTFDNIADGDYPISRSLYVYIKNAHLGVIPGLSDFAEELISEQATGEEGYLTDKGLIPLSEEEREAVQAQVTEALAKAKAKKTPAAAKEKK